MNSFIVVRGNGRTVKVRAENDGTVSEDTLRHAFQLEQDVPIGLYRNEIALKCHRNGDDFVFELETEWIGAEFELSWEEARRSRPATPIEQAQSNLPIYVPIEVDDLICRLENYLFFEEVGDTKCCFTIISPHHAVSFNHGHHHDWNSSPIENQTIVTICNQEGKKFETKVIECDAEVDFIVVRSEVSLVSKPPIIGIPRKLERYILLGYPNVNSSYQALEGVFSSIERDDEGRMRGSSGSNRGYSGGPIFNYRGELLGINVANEFIGFNGKSTVNEIVSEMNATFPFLSVIVPTYCIAFKYHKDCKFKP